MLASVLLLLLVGSDALIDRNVVRDCSGADLDRAIIACGRIIEKLPHSEQQVAVAYFYLGRAEYIKHQVQQAIDDFGKALAINPRFAEAFSERGSAYLTLNRVDLAIADCSQAIQIIPNNAAYRYNCGNAYWHGRLLDQAVAQFSEAIRLQPQFPHEPRPRRG
jgi:tetratricopeptide (TPR) repeat protein